MSNVKIDKEGCKSCSLCIKACPKGVIAIGEHSNNSGYFYAEVVKPELCSACSLCAVMCPDAVIEITRPDKV